MEKTISHLKDRLKSIKATQEFQKTPKMVVITITVEQAEKIVRYYEENECGKLLLS